MAVVRLARRVEAWAGRPQDVEWAIDQAGRVHLLQARPVTVVGSSRRAATRWTRDNVGEVVPDPVTPLSWSVLEPLGNGAFAGVLRRLGMGRVPAGLFGRFYGRVYLNQTLFQAVMGRFYISHAGWRALPRLAPTGLRVLWQLFRLPGEAERVIRAVQERRWAEEGLDLAAPAPADLLDRVEEWRRLGAAVMEVHLAVTTVAELLYQTLDKVLSRWGDGSVGPASLMAGLKGGRSAEVGRALAALAREVRRDEGLRDLVMGTVPQALPARLAETEPGRALWARIEAFLAEHGHGAPQEFELAAPRWRDDPTVILSALQAQVRAAGEEPTVDPAAVRIAATARVERRLNPAQRWLFRRLLRWAQAFTLAREDLKYHFVLAHGRLRDLYLDIAAGLVAEGRLGDREDIFFLTANEVEELVGGERTPEEGRRRVAERRRAWEGYQKGVPPQALDQWADGRLWPVIPSAPPGGGDGPLLRGLAASPGAYTGRARVVRTVDDGAALEAGEVLIAPAASPGWAPLLMAAGALVTEIGGALSHGAIIAREYGLPAVLNVGDATRRIRTGQLVHVDGSAGVVRLVE
jgi:pyruvate,water dikinase